MVQTSTVDSALHRLVDRLISAIKHTSGTVSDVSHFAGEIIDESARSGDISAKKGSEMNVRFLVYDLYLALASSFISHSEIVKLPTEAILSDRVLASFRSRLVDDSEQTRLTTCLTQVLNEDRYQDMAIIEIRKWGTRRSAKQDASDVDVNSYPIQYARSLFALREYLRTNFRIQISDDPLDCTFGANVSDGNIGKFVI